MEAKLRYLIKGDRPLQIAHAKAAHAGIVIIQAATILPPTVQRAAETRLDATTPIIEAETMWVVERGIPILEAISITVAATVSAAKPLIGLNCASLMPNVFMILHPPTAVPKDIAQAHTPITHKGTSKVER